MFKKLFASLTGKNSSPVPEQEEMILGKSSSLTNNQTTIAKVHERTNRRQKPRLLQLTPDGAMFSPDFYMHLEDGKYVDIRNPERTLTYEEAKAKCALPLDDNDLPEGLKLPGDTTELPQFVQRRTQAMPAYKG